MFNMLDQLNMEDIVIVNEIIKAMIAWERMNKYYNGKYQIIILNNFDKEIYIAHNISNYEITIESGYDFINTIKDLFKEYSHDKESKEYLKEFWKPKVEEILNIQDNL